MTRGLRLIVLAVLATPLSAAWFPSRADLSASIFVIEIDRVDAEQNWVVDGRITRVFRDRNHLNLSPGAFHTALTTANVDCAGDCPAHWEETEFHAGDRFVIFSNEKEQVNDLIAGPSHTQRLRLGVQALSDLELILAANELPWEQQPLAVANALPQSPGPHDWLLAVYSADLLMGDGPLVDALVLERALKNTGFSDEGNAALLRTLTSNLRLPSNDPRMAYTRSALFALAPRYLLEDTGTPLDGGLTRVPHQFLFACDRVSCTAVWGGLNATLDEPARARIRSKLFAIASAPRVSSEGRERALWFVELLRPQ